MKSRGIYLRIDWNGRLLRARWPRCGTNLGVTEAFFAPPPDEGVEISTPQLRLGVAVVGIPFQGDGIDAFCAWRGGTPSMVVLRDAPGDRLRFGVAHELGHLVLHRGERRTGKDLEAQADEFPARLLTPPEGLLRDLPPHPTLAALTMVKTKWGCRSSR